jgi:hypothetical protein
MLSGTDSGGGSATGGDSISVRTGGNEGSIFSWLLALGVILIGVLVVRRKYKLSK